MNAWGGTQETRTRVKDGQSGLLMEHLWKETPQNYCFNSTWPSHLNGREQMEKKHSYSTKCSFWPKLPCTCWMVNVLNLMKSSQNCFRKYNKSQIWICLKQQYKKEWELNTWMVHKGETNSEHSLHFTTSSKVYAEWEQLNNCWKRTWM